MRFWPIGCTIAVLMVAGCDDKTDSSAALTTPPPPLDKLKIEDTKVGKGPVAKDGEVLLMEYTGKLGNGKVFDSTSKHGDTPFAFVLGQQQVIKGWDVGLVGMREGGERKLSIPYAMAYGDESKGDALPAKSDLYFDVKLDKVVAPDDALSVEEEITKHGTGPKVKKGDEVQVLYTGSFVNGKVFDTNRNPGGKPLDVKVGAGQVVQGFDKGLEGMQKGEHRTLTIPPTFGYGGESRGQIPANSWLVFDVEITSIK
jgi:peptidylprolyl isomerase